MWPARTWTRRWGFDFDFRFWKRERILDLYVGRVSGPREVKAAFSMARARERMWEGAVALG